MNFENDITRCVTALQNDETILYPTDTVWGLGADAKNNDAAKKVFEIKNRPENKSLIILLADAGEIKNYARTPSDIVYDQINNATAPLTIIYPEAKNLASSVINSDGTIAIRIVKDRFCKMLIETFGGPLISTSANIAGKPTPQIFSDIEDEIKKRVDCIASYRQDDTTKRPPSQIIRWTGADDFERIR